MYGEIMRECMDQKRTKNEPIRDKSDQLNCDRRNKSKSERKSIRRVWDRIGNGKWKVIK
jgi:hypothetical protein